jgi:hypothetical protein
MSDKTILERGLTTFTRPEPLAFEFDGDTKRLELVQYFAYCKTNNLLTTTGEQSRLALTRKTYNHLGAAGSSAEIAMRTWLQSRIPSAETAIDKLWILYFAKYATVGDSKSVTYEGLSLEAGYRKFLYEFIGAAASYNDKSYVTELVKTSFGKIAADPLAVSELVQTILTVVKSYADSASASESVLVVQNKALPDALQIVDSISLKLTVSISEGVLVSETYSTAGGTSNTNGSSAQADAASATETVSFVVAKVLGDSASVTEAFSLESQLVFSDQASCGDSFTYVITSGDNYLEDVFVQEVVLILFNKAFTDSASVSETQYSGMIGYNGGSYNDYYFSA